MLTEADVRRRVPPGGFIPRYLRYVEDCTDAPLSVHLVNALVILAQTLPPEAAISFGEAIHGNLYGLVVGSAGATRKSTAMKLASKVLSAVLPDVIGDRPNSYEALIDNLVAKPKQVIYYDDFGAEFLPRAYKLGGPMHAVKGGFTEAWSNTRLGRSTVRGSRSVDDPRLSLMGATAPDMLDQYVTIEDWTGGFMSRFFTVYVPKRERFLVTPQEHPAYREDAVNHLRNIVENQPAVVGRHTGFTSPAKALWREWLMKLEAHRNGDQVPLEVQAALARADTFALKIALLLAWDRGDARSGGPWQLEDDIIMWAIRLTEIHVQSSLTVGQRLATSFDMRDRRRVLEILTPEPQSLGDVQLRAKMLKGRAKMLLESLLEEGTVRYATDAAGRTGYALTRPLQQVTLDATTHQPVEGAGTNENKSSSSPATLTSSSVDAGGASGWGATSPSVGAALLLAADSIEPIPASDPAEDDSSYIPVWDD